MPQIQNVNVNSHPENGSVDHIDHQELHEALVWLRRAVTIGETALLHELAPEVREEWMLALEKKPALLVKLERLNHTLLAPAPEDELPHVESHT